MTKNNHYSYDKGKRIGAAISIILCVAIVIIILLSLRTCTVIDKTIYAGIGGAVVDRGVYPITEGETLYELIQKAKGITPNANLEKVDINQLLTPWETYCIPYSSELSKSEPKPVKVYSEPEVKLKNYKQDIEEVNIVYAGLPRTFILITVYPELELIKVGHIPWYTIIPNSNKELRTLYEMYLIGGPSSLVKSVEALTSLDINHYFAHDRKSWMKFIDHLQGIKVDIPKEFAKQYRINSGIHIIDGYTSWRYITYISEDMRKIDVTTGSHNRIKRQKDFMRELYKKFKSMDFFISSKVGPQILSEADTNIDPKFAMAVARRVSAMKNAKIEFYNLPGVVRRINGKKYWDTNLDTYKQFKEDLKRVGD